MVKILVTGSAGFIGFHLVSRLLKENDVQIFGLDNINDYYNVDLKFDRLLYHGLLPSQLIEKEYQISSKYPNYTFVKASLENNSFIVDLMINEKFDYVVNLAAQAGVRYSLENPFAYINSNINGFLSILEGCKLSNVKHLLYASTSSVYGLNSLMPLDESYTVDHPISLYAATKKSNELMAHSYSHLYKLPTTGLRFFTVYGPWGRPDMALYLFADAMVKGKPINVFNHGNMVRDFTYVDDIVESIFRIIKKPAKSNPNWDSNKPNNFSSIAPYQIFNIGNSSPVNLNVYINTLENCLGIKAKKVFLEIQKGDVLETHASIKRLEDYIEYKPTTSVEKGIQQFINWFRLYKKL